MTFDPNFRVCECGAVYYEGAGNPDLRREAGIPVGHICLTTVKNLPMPPAPVGAGRLRSRKDDKPTSIAAGESFTKERPTELQRRVLEFFRRVKEATDEELEDALINEVPAASTLTFGYLRDSGRTRKNRNNREMVVWEIKREQGDES